jgi:mannonate dehydratase
LQYFARYGVRNICGYPQIAGGRLYATVDELKSMRDLAEKNGISVDCLAPPFLASSHIDREKHGAIMLAESPERDRDIEAMQTLIRNCAAAGIPSIKYNMSILGVLRTGRTPGRGDATYSTWRLKDGHPDPPLTRAGRVTADPSGSASPTSWSASSRWRRRTRSAWPAIRTIPACRPRATRA